MDWQKINIQKYATEVRRKAGMDISDEIIAKDLLLTLVLAEFEKEKGVFNHLVFKDQMVKFNIHVPKKLNKKQIELIKQLEEESPSKF